MANDSYPYASPKSSIRVDEKLDDWGGNWPLLRVDILTLVSAAGFMRALRDTEEFSAFPGWAYTR